MRLGLVLRSLKNAKWIMVLHQESVSIDMPWKKYTAHDIFIDNNAKESIINKFGADALVKEIVGVDKAEVKIVLA